MSDGSKIGPLSSLPAPRFDQAGHPIPSGPPPAGVSDQDWDAAYDALADAMANTNQASRLWMEFPPHAQNRPFFREETAPNDPSTAYALSPEHVVGRRTIVVPQDVLNALPVMGLPDALSLIEQLRVEQFERVGPLSGQTRP